VGAIILLALRLRVDKEGAEPPPPAKVNAAAENLLHDTTVIRRPRRSGVPRHAVAQNDRGIR